MTLDDFEARPGGTPALLRTIIGSALRDEGRWMPTAAFVRLMEVVGVPSGRTRTTLTRLKNKGLLLREERAGSPGYALSEQAIPMLERGDARIYHPRQMDQDDRWFIVSFSVPEENRDLRHQLRRRLAWIGCGFVAGALWIGPAHLVEEAEQIVAELGLAGRVTVFMVDELRGATEPREAVARWWDLDSMRELHDGFIEAHQDAMAEYEADPSPENAFRTWIRVLDTWRPIPYLDPGLPLSILPPEWPGARSVPLFLRLRDALSEPAGRFIHSVVEDVAKKAPSPASPAGG